MNDATPKPRLIEEGGDQTPEELLPLVYQELRRLASAKMAREAPGQTLQATALVHEAWLRLMGGNHPQFANRSHFFAAAGEAMRRVLVDKARAKASLKRGNNQGAEELHESRIAEAVPGEETLAVHEALDGLSGVDATAAVVVKLRYFVGMTIPEIAEALEISSRSADRHWAFARAWLKEAIRHS